MKTILFLANGTSVHSYKWISFFSKKHSIVWLSIDGFEDSYTKNAEVKYVDCKVSSIKLINILFGLIKILFLSIKSKFDLIHVHYLGYHTLLATFKKKVPLVLTTWGSDIVLPLHSNLKKKFLKFYINRAKVITCDSHHMQEKINSFAGNEKKINLINFGIDTSYYIKIKKNQSLIKSLEINSNNILISTRNHEDIYDIKTLIDSIVRVKEDFPDVVCLIAGSGTKTSELKNQVLTNNLNNNVKFVGRLSSENIRDYLSIASVYISTSLSDGGIAASTAEAMSSEVPCIVSDVADNSEWIINLDTGLLFEASNSEQLSKGITKLLNDRKLSNRLAKKGRKIIIDKNDYKNEMSKMDLLYQSILNDV